MKQCNTTTRSMVLVLSRAKLSQKWSPSKFCHQFRLLYRKWRSANNSDIQIIQNNWMNVIWILQWLWSLTIVVNDDAHLIIQMINLGNDDDHPVWMQTMTAYDDWNHRKHQQWKASNYSDDYHMTIVNGY